MNVQTFILLLGLIQLAYSRGYVPSYNSGGNKNKFRATDLRTWPPEKKAAVLALGTVYIPMRMRARYGSGKEERADVRICRNEQLFPKYNGSIEVYGWFLCPLKNYTDAESYCCGSSGNEYCCDFWSSPDAIGAYIGFAFLGVGIIAGVVVLIVFYKKPELFRYKSQRNQSQVGDHSQPVAVTNFGANNYGNYSYNNPVVDDKNTASYPQQQYGMYPPQYQSPPPSYASVSGGAAPS